MSYNKDELEAPDWINSEFLVTVLNHSNNSNNVKVSEYKISPATKAGEHYSSIMFRANVKFSLNNKPDDISLIIKTMPQVDGMKKDMLEVTDIFETESTIYDKILPEMSILLKKAGIQKPLSSRMLYYSVVPHKVIVFEDLKKLGFDMHPRRIPLNDEIQIIMIRLAEFHAASFKMAADGNKHITKFKTGGSFSLPIMNAVFFKDAFDQFKALISSMEDCEVYAKKLEPITHEMLLSKCIKEIDTLGSYNVLNHADFHCNNFMFKLNKNKTASEVILVDFQLCLWGSPALDISYGKILNPLETRKEFDEFYFNTFIDILKKMNYTGKLPTLSDLKSELKRFQCVELFIYMLFYPFLCQDFKEKDVDMDMDKLFSSPERAVDFYTSKIYKETTKHMLPIFLEEGHFDTIMEIIEKKLFKVFYLYFYLRNLL